MKSLLLIISFLSFHWTICNSQEYPVIDSLKNELRKNPAPPAQVSILKKLCENYWSSDLDSAFAYGQKALNLARQIGDAYNEAWLWSYLGGGYLNMGKYPESFQSLFGALKFGIANKYPDQTVNTLALIGAAYADLKDFRQAINYYDQGLETSNKIQSAGGVVMLELLKATAYRNNNQLDSASDFVQKAVAGDDTLNNLFVERTLFAELGIIQFRKGDHTNAFKNLHKSISIDKSENDHRALAITYNHLSEIFFTTDNEDSSLIYARLALQEAQRNGYKREILRSSKLLAELYDQRDIKEALHYLKMSNATNEEMFGAYKAIVLQRTLADEQERQSQAELEKIANRNRLKQYAFLAGLGVLILVAVLLYRNNLREKKAKNQLQEKNKVIDRTLSDLRSTQTQLIQSAKMASLGELTAGIAHEIQNPLNFVNNFSEVNAELLQELQDGPLKNLPETEKQQADMLISDLNQNLEKINQHGKRADSIVKGMLQHSRSSTGQKEQTDINALADEYLRLSYHGMRAKDKTFNAEIQTDFDASIGKINIVPQDIGRVLLNLYNNAFYAIGERFKVNGLGYKPAISITTRKVDARTEDPVGRGKINITVRDNGTGIPEKIKDKIFQPFFTTKATGQGTGLGLSLSYDIVKAHGGEIIVVSKESEGSEFVVQLPV